MFETPEIDARLGHINNGWYPFGVVDGLGTFSMEQYANYALHTAEVNDRLETPSPVSIALDQADENTLEITVTNDTGNPFEGTLQVVIKENGIPYTWYDHNTVNHNARDFLPDADGEAVSLGSSESTTVSREFTIGENWVRDNCRFVAFVEGSDKEIHQAAVLDME